MNDAELQFQYMKMNQHRAVQMDTQVWKPMDSQLETQVPGYTVISLRERLRRPVYDRVDIRVRNLLRTHL
jgi:hypothetical protein